MADDLEDLLLQLDGRMVKERVLKTKGAEPWVIPMSMRERLFQAAWRPEVLMILMLMAVYGVITEVSHPGGVIPGVVGVVALILALYMSAALPVNTAGLALISLAVLLFVAEAFTPGGEGFFGGDVGAVANRRPELVRRPRRPDKPAAVPRGGIRSS